MESNINESQPKKSIWSKKPIKFIYGLLIISIIGGGFSFWFLKNSENIDFRNQSFNNKKSVIILPDLNKKIIEIDKTKNNIDNLLKNKFLKESKEEIKNSPYEPGSQIIYTDKDGKILKYEKRIGGEDSALEYSFYYNENSKLIFALITGGATNGSELEHKIYFNDTGERISETHKITKGPGYSWSEIWPENEIVFNPTWKTFNNELGYSIDLPDSFTANSGFTASGIKYYTSKDQKYKDFMPGVEVVQSVTEKDFWEYYQSLVKDSRMDSKVKGDTWFVISGKENYVKAFIKNGVQYDLLINYNDVVFKSVVEKIGESFKFIQLESKK